MDEVRFSHFASQQLMTRKRCHTDNNLPCPTRAKITNSACIECANRYYQTLTETEREDMINE